MSQSTETNCCCQCKCCNITFHCVYCRISTRKDKRNPCKSFCKTRLSTYCLYTHWNKHIIENKTIDISRVSPGTDLAYFYSLRHYAQAMLNNPLVADSWISKSVCNLSLTTSTVKTTLSSSSGQRKTPWDWINKYKQRMFFNLLSIWSTGYFSSSETKACLYTIKDSLLYLLPSLMIPVDLRAFL